MTNMEASQRLLYIDRLKGIAIIIVVCGHFIQYNVADFKHNPLFSFIYSFHMPLFMFISGYVAHKTTSTKIFENYTSFLRKKLLSLLLPFFVWPLIVEKFFFVKDPDYNFVKTIIQLVTNPQGGLWFLWFLFFLVILHSVFLYFSNSFNAKNNLLLDALMCSVILGILCFIKYLDLINYIDSFILYYIFFFLGIVISKYNYFTSYILRKGAFTIFLSIFILLVGRYEFDNQGKLNFAIKLIVALNAIFSLYYIVKSLHFNVLFEKFILLCGKNSIIIYTTHFTVIHLFTSQYILPDLSFLLLILITLSFSLIIVGFCFLVFKIVELSPFLNLMLYGNHKELFAKKPDNIIILSGTLIND